MNQQDRAVTPVIAIILMVAVLIVLAAAISVSFFGVTEDINEPAPNVADTTGEFEPGSDIEEQIVRITHASGENVNVDEIQIIVRASGPEVNAEARLIDLPGETSLVFGDLSIDDRHLQGDDAIISQTAPWQVLTEDDSNVWGAGDTIQFRIAVGGADFRDEENRNGPEADELDVLIVHTPSDAILSEHTFTP